MRCLFLIGYILFGSSLFSETPPEYLYKVTSAENWEKSQGQKFLILDPMDDKFIHLATEKQLDRIISKFWQDNPSFVVLKLKVSLLPGNLVFETNPGGTNRYYHLYNGSIPMDAAQKQP